MASTVNKLNAKALPTTSGRHADGNGLYLNIRPKGHVGWVFLYFLNGKRIERGFGSIQKVSLAQARLKTRAAQADLTIGVDPFPKKNQAAAVPEGSAGGPLFSKVAIELMDALRPTWRNAKHNYQWHATLKNQGALIWELPVDSIETELVLAVLRPIWSKTPETAVRLRGRIEKVLDAARVKGLRQGENPARWKGHLELLLPKRNKKLVRHHPAMPYEEIPGFVQSVRRRSSISALALEFTIFTAARTSETISAVWSEFDIEKAVWTIPAERMKAGVEHRVPLTARPLALLAHMRFLGKKGPFPLSIQGMQMLLRRMEVGEYTVHGFRSAFRDWVGEETEFPREVAEAALAHQVGNEVERAYRRGDALEKRRKLMEAWEDYLTKPCDLSETSEDQSS